MRDSLRGRLSFFVGKFRLRKKHFHKGENIMSTRGRTVRIFLADGIPNGVLTAEIMNWTGRFTVAPRSQ
jgi:hypothetical protein